MAITAATSSSNNIVRKGPGKTIFEEAKPVVSASSTWLQGEILCFDTSSHIIRRVAATGDAATLLGVADNVVTSGKLAGPYDGLTAVDAAQVSPGIVGPKYGVEVSLVLKTADAINPGDKVYLADGLSTQTVSVTDPGDHNHVGIYLGAAIASAAAGQLITVLLGARYPAGTGGTLLL